MIVFPAFFDDVRLKNTVTTTQSFAKQFIRAYNSQTVDEVVVD